ncbi:GH39 family glycosyl hydrolase [Luedemannella helvata]|uniref:Cellulase family glycosylhydrolase n=1 Tax=Luedemannella helvata TaxID=349315 RepID=A0ABN2JSB2_9ACTN
MINVPDDPIGRLPDAWRFCVGTGRFELALRRDYQDSLALVQKDIGFRYIRGHGLLSDGVGVYRPHEYGVRYAFTYVDQVVDAYLGLGIRPFVELGFMPYDLASGDQTVFWWQGNVTPPRSWTGWAELVKATVAHLVDRYGLDEVRQWPIEVWNEPNLAPFWQDADRDAYHRLYEVTAHAVKEVDAELLVGGPALSPGAGDWMARFADFVEDRQVPINFVSCHAYSSGPAQHVPFGTHQTLAPATKLLDQFAEPRATLAGTALAGLPVHITEFNSSYRPDNPIHDTAFHAAYLAPVLAGGGDHVDSFSYWTFSDMFEEVGIPTALFHGGFGLLTHRQLKKPTYHLYAFMARLGGEALARGDDHLVTRHPDGRLAVLAWAPVDVEGTAVGPGDGHRVRLSVPLAGAADAFVARAHVGEDAGNAYAVWCAMGRPLSPRTREIEVLREAAEPVRRYERLPVADGRVTLDLALGRHEVTLVEVSAVVDETPPWWSDSHLLGRGDE